MIVSPIVGEGLVAICATLGDAPGSEHPQHNRWRKVARKYGLNFLNLENSSVREKLKLQEYSKAHIHLQ